MGTVFQHLPKISEETIDSITLSSKIITMQVSIFCCVLVFIGYVNGSPWSNLHTVKRSDGPVEREEICFERSADVSETSHEIMLRCIARSDVEGQKELMRSDKVQERAGEEICFERSILPSGREIALRCVA